MNVDAETRKALDAIEDAQARAKWQAFYAATAVALLVAFIAGATLQIMFTSGDARALSVFTIVFGVGGSGIATAFAVDELRSAQVALRKARRRHRDLLLDGA